MSGFIYLGTDASGLWKIGITKDINKREKQFKTGNFSFRMLLDFEVENPAIEEIKIHTTFESKRVMGEWFKLEPEDLFYFYSTFSKDKIHDLNAFREIHRMISIEKNLGDIEWLTEIDRRLA